MANVEEKRTQIAQVLETRYFPIIQPLQQNWTPEQHKKNRLSRALAAFGVEKLAELTPAQAGNAVVDGGSDNGIDAVHFDKIKNRLWVLQAKIGDAPDMGENKKFCDGIRDLMKGEFQRFNTNIARLQPEIEEALATDGLQLIGCQIHLGEELGPHAREDLEKLKAELNQFVVRFDWRDLNLSEVHAMLMAEHAVQPVNVQLTLERWYGVEEPRKAFYGVVPAAKLAEFYLQHGKALFEKNIRHYLGAEEVNAQIAATAEEKPADFFYLNNGLTAVCDEIRPTPGATHQKGVFQVKGFSIVNGAQTVGSLASSAVAKGVVSPAAKVLITLIEVGGAQDNLGGQITRARNTQNAIKGLNFAALDPHQERLRQELKLSEIEYYYRPSAEARQGGPNTISIEQAVIALASLSGNTKIVVAAKKSIGLLYDNYGEFYPQLFRPDLTGLGLARRVRIFEFVDGIFAASERAEASYSRRKMFYRHGRYFILHIFARRHQALLRKPEITLSESDKADISRAAIDIAELVYVAAEAKFANLKGYLSIFRNMTDADPLARDVMQRLAAAQAAGAVQAQSPGANSPV